MIGRSLCRRRAHPHSYIGVGVGVVGIGMCIAAVTNAKGDLNENREYKMNVK